MASPPRLQSPFLPVCLLLVGPACRDEPSDTAAEAVGWPDIATPEQGWLRGDLHFHTNYSGDALEQGGDWMGPALAIADAWRDEEWQAFTGRESSDYLDFVAVTDHRTTEGLSDPDFGHDFLVVIGGEEFGSDGHAGVWGISEYIDHNPVAGESQNQRISDAIGEAHAAGALFSLNHPLYSGDLWGWDTPGFDGVEVWNGPWSTMSEPLSVEQLDAWVAANGVENAAVRVAAQLQGAGQNAQALRFWQAWLQLGVHVPPVGGGDRHMVFPAGLPTTYVAAPTADPAGVLAGIAAGATFVSRGPSGPQVRLSAALGDQSWPMGADIEGWQPGQVVAVEWKAARAAGGELRLVAGAVDPGLAEPEIVERVTLDGDEVSGSFAWTPPADGGWLHAVVVDPLPDPSLAPDDFADAYAALTTYPEDGGLSALLLAVAPLVDMGALGEPGSCVPQTWSPWQLACMPADTEPLGSFYVPDPVLALLCAEFEEGQPTGYAMGAVSAAFMVQP